jgi:methylisocitrate lyase
MGAAMQGLDELNERGSFAGALDRMQHRAELYDLIDYEGYNRFDTSIFDFTLER